jgi:regulatory protein
MMSRGQPAPSLKARALRLLSQREHSRLELERKLAKHETEPGTLAQALDWLQGKGFINETRVAESVVQRKAARMGTARIAQELAQKGLRHQPQRARQAAAVFGVKGFCGRGGAPRGAACRL